jgi:hypothetical protein
MNKLYIEGWVSTDDDGIIAVKENKDDSDWNAESVPNQIKYFAQDHGRVRSVNKGLGGTKAYIFDANIYIYFTDEKSTFEEAQESLICELYGDVETDIRLCGYSEYTITGYSLEDFSIGGHDLENEINNHIGEYMHFVLEC